MSFMISVVQVLYFIQRKNDLYAMQKKQVAALFLDVHLEGGANVDFRGEL